MVANTKVMCLVSGADKYRGIVMMISQTIYEHKSASLLANLATGISYMIQEFRLLAYSSYLIVS